MNSEHEIRLSGPFNIFDSSGVLRHVSAIRIVDESYGIIDVYVDLASSTEEEPLHEDPAVIRQILARLRRLGYEGPDFGPGDPGMQDDGLLVLEAPEPFGIFAARMGWKNLAAEYHAAEDGVATANSPDAVARNLFSALMQRLRES